MALKDVKSRIASVKNIQKITRAMEMVAAARLRRAEQRIEALRPYAGAIRRMTRQAAEAAGNVPNLPILNEHESEDKIGILLVTGDRGLAGAFNSQIVRAGIRAGAEYESGGKSTVWYACGRRGVSSLAFRGREAKGAYAGFTERPAYANAREIAVRPDGRVRRRRGRRVEIVYNRYVSPLTQEVTRETLLPLQHATILEGGEGLGGRASSGEEERERRRQSALVEYEPDPEEILERLIPAYVEISIYRALLESTASEHGARMTAMRNASENAGDIIKDLTLQFNRERQAAITQEIMEVVAGASRWSKETHLAATTETEKQNVGRIEEIQGIVVEAVFPDKLPEINSAIVDHAEENPSEDSKFAGGISSELVCEVQQHLGDDRVRAVAMDTTDGLSRGMEVIDTGGPITVPVGDVALGRIFNLLGETIDQGEPIEVKERWPIHRSAPTVEDLTPTTEMFETGIKVVDLLAPYAQAARSACSAAPAWARPC